MISILFSTCTQINPDFRLYTELVEDALEELVYAASLAGLDYLLDSRIVGMKLTLNGFDDKLIVLLQTVLETMKNLQVRADRLEVVKEKVKRGWKNFGYNTPYQVSDHAVQLVITENVYEYEVYLKELPSKPLLFGSFRLYTKCSLFYLV